MKLLIIILLIFLLLSVYGRYKKLLQALYDQYQNNKYKLPDELIVDLVRIPDPAKKQSVIDHFDDLGYDLQRKFKFGNETDLHLFANENGFTNFIDLLTGGKQPPVGTSAAKVELEGGLFNDVQFNYLTLFPTQRINTPQIKDAFKKCKKKTSSEGKEVERRPSNKKQNKQRYNKNQETEGEQTSNQSKQNRLTLQSCIELTTTRFGEAPPGSKLSFKQGIQLVEIKVALVDSKTNFTMFPAFEDKVMPGSVYPQYLNDPSNDFNGLDLSTSEDHGTFMASIIASQYKGEAKMLVSNFPFHDGEQGHLMDLLAAIYSAVDHGVHILNLSLGFYADDMHAHIQRAFDYAARHNTLIVCAAGNFRTNNDLKNFWPANMSHLSNVVSVAATDSSGNAWIESADLGTNVGPIKVNFAANGKEVQGLVASGEVRALSGTSSAAAALTSIASNILSDAGAALSASELKTALINKINKGEGIFSDPAVSIT